MPAIPTPAAHHATPQSARALELHPAVLKFRDAARQQFADRLERIILYGSRARCDHRPDSDYDIAIFVRDLDNPYTEYAALAALAGQILAEHDIEINARLHPAAAWRASSAPLHRHIRQDGIEL